MGRVIVGLIILVYPLLGGWCIQHAMQKRVYKNEDKTFLAMFPKGVICKKRGYYHFISGPYLNKKELKSAFAKAKKLHTDAYIKRCNNIKCSSTAKISQDHKPIKKKVKAKVKVIKKNKVAQFQTAPLRQTEDSFIQNVMQHSHKKSSHVYKLTLQEYLKRLLQKDYGLKSKSYDAKIKRLEAILEQSRYEWQIYFNAAARYAKFIDYSLITDKELTVNAGINIDKRLFDRDYPLVARIRYLKEQLAKVDFLNAKEQLSLLGVAIYSEALLAWELKSIYEKEYFNQKRFYNLIKERGRVGVASRVDVIDAKNDLLELRKDLLKKIYDYTYSDHLLRSSIELNISKRVELENIGFALETKDLPTLYKEAYLHNSTIRRMRLLYGLKKAKVVSSEKSMLPIIDFHGALFYEYKKDFSLIPHQKAKGLNYSGAVSVKIPLIGGDACKLHKQKVKIEALKQKNRLLDTIKKSAQQIYKLYNENKRLQKHLDIVQQQIALMYKKLQIVRKRYIEGLSVYRDFNDALKNYLHYIEEKATIKTAMIRNSAQLLILIGQQIADGQN